MINAAVRRAKINFAMWAETLQPGCTVHEASGLTTEEIRLLASLLDISLGEPDSANWTGAGDGTAVEAVQIKIVRDPDLDTTGD